MGGEGAARRKPFYTKKNIQAWLNSARTYMESPKNIADETKVEPFSRNSKRLDYKQHCRSPKKHHTHIEAWQEQHYALGLFSLEPGP